MLGWKRRNTLRYSDLRTASSSMSVLTRQCEMVPTVRVVPMALPRRRM